MKKAIKALKVLAVGTYFVSWMAVVVMFILGFMSNDAVGLWCLNHFPYAFAAGFVLMALMPGLDYIDLDPRPKAQT